MNNLSESIEVQNALRELISLQDCGIAEDFKTRLNSALDRLSKAKNLKGMREIVGPQLKFISGHLAAVGLTPEQLIESFFPQ